MALERKVRLVLETPIRSCRAGIRCNERYLGRLAARDESWSVSGDTTAQKGLRQQSP